MAPPASCTWSAIAPAISGPIVIGGTKWPSITSTWISRAPASMTSATCAPRRAKSDERIDGATRFPAYSSWREAVVFSVAASISGPSVRVGLDVAQHRVAALLAAHVLASAHPADRPMLAAVRALRDELVAAQAEDA